jgi:hypothetical protein
VLTLEQYFNELPKKYVHPFYKQIQSNSGVTQGSQMLEEVLAWAADTQRLKTSLQNMESSDKLVLASIYSASSRGLYNKELHNLAKHSESSAIAEAVHRLEQDIWIYTRKGASLSFHGFDNLQKLVWDTLFEEQKQAPLANISEGLVDYRHFLRSHLLHLMTLIQKENIKITQEKSLHAKYMQRLTQAFCYSEVLSAAISKEEILFLLQFLIDQDWVQEKDSHLFLTPKGLEACEWDSEKYDQTLFLWWHENRFIKNQGLLKAVSECSNTTWPIQNLCIYFWAVSGELSQFIKVGTLYSDYKDGITWEQLPHAIREMWFLGLISLATQKGKIHAVKWHSERIIACLEGFFPKDKNAAPPMSLPNYEMLLPPESSTKLRYIIEMIGIKTSDEHMSRYTISKDSLIKGFKGGLSTEAFEFAINNIPLSPENKTVLEEWASCYLAGTFNNMLVLKMHHLEKFQELQDIPQFIKLVSEVIPNYGFVVPEYCKEDVQKFLEQFGLFPGDTTLSSSTDSLSPISIPELYPSAQENTAGDLIPFDQKTPKLVTKKTASKTIESKAPDLEGKIKILADALEFKKKVELSFVERNRQRVLIRPIHLVQKKPETVIAVDIQSGHRSQYGISEITSLRIVE